LDVRETDSDEYITDRQRTGSWAHCFRSRGMTSSLRQLEHGTQLPVSVDWSQYIL